MPSACSTSIGTSGWSYPSGYGKWSGIVYPKSWSGDELAFYAERFPAVEVNVSFYRIPGVETVRGWLDRTPKHFLFAVKLYRKFTHPDFYQREEGRSPRILPGDIAQMRNLLNPLAEAGRLGALLVQYPEFFHCREENVDTLTGTLDTFRDYPLAVELRHHSWDNANAEMVLDRFAAARVRIDEPFYRNLQGTGSRQEPFEYFRFHGRNAVEWRRPGAGARRYEYHYSREEIMELAEAIDEGKNKGRRQFAFFNNHVSGMAVANAIALAASLDLPLPYPKFSHLAGRFPELREITGEEGGQLHLLDA